MLRCLRVLIAVAKHHDPKANQKKKVYLVYTSLSYLILKGNRDKNSNRTGTCWHKLMQKLWRRASYWLVPHGLLRIQYYHLTDVTTYNGLDPPSNIKTMSYSLAYSLILCRHFLNGVSLLSDESSLCHIDIKLCKHIWIT